MGNRGSKSEFENSVKEQRVDGSWCIEKKKQSYAFKVYSYEFWENFSSQNPF